MNKKLLTKLILILFIIMPLLMLSDDAITADWEWQNPLIQGNNLYDVWGSSSTDVFAVGWDGIIIHYNGSIWSEMDNPLREMYYITASLRDVWGSSSNDVFAVGYYSDIVGICIEEFGIILHYDGSTWSRMKSGMKHKYSLHAVWGSSATDVFAVGENHFDSGIFHYDGSTWSEMNNPISKMIYNPFDVWGSSSTDVFAVGWDGIILHYDGSTWSEMESCTTRRLYDVWGSSSTDVFAVGYDGTILHYGEIESTTTTTTVESTTTTTTGPCTAEELYRECSEETELLRYLRDNVLSKTPEGQEIVRLYYQWSPVIVKAMEEDDEFEEWVKEMIDGVLPLIEGTVE